MPYVLPGAADRAKRLPRPSALLFDSDASGMRLVNRDADTGTFRRPHCDVHVPMRAYVRRLIPVVHALGPSPPRAIRLGDAIKAQWPARPLRYPHLAGIDPARPWRGPGGAAICASLMKCDADGVPAYPETVTQSNVGLYVSLGCALNDESLVPRGGTCEPPRLPKRCRCEQEAPQ